MEDPSKKKLLVTDNEGNTSRLIDGDTEIDAQGNRQRLAGGNAREIAKVETDKYGEERVVPPQLGANLQAEIVQKIIEEGNFGDKVLSSKYDAYDREIYDRFDPNGRSLSETLIANGIFEVDEYTSESAIRAKLARDVNEQLKGEQGEFANYEQQLNNKFDSQGLMFKGSAVNEANYDPRFHSSVQFRDHDRDLANNQIGFWSQAGSGFSQSWSGIKEGLYGYAEGLGETIGSDGLADIGSQGVARARAAMKEAPAIVLDYREVDSIMKGFQYVMNNTAMAAPYMGLTIGSMALAIPTGGAVTALTGSLALGRGIALGSSVLPNSIIYAGQIWNEMEGPKGAGQFVAASVGGVSASVIERFGFSKIMPKTTLLTNNGVEKVAKALVKERNVLISQGSTLPRLSLSQAKQAVSKATRQAQATYAKTLAKLTPDDIRRFSALGVAKAVGSSALIEAGTEIAQESIQMATAQAFSEKQYEFDNVFNRLMNAGIAGGAIGGTIGGVARGRAEVRDYLAKQDLTNIGDPSRLDTIARKKVEDLESGKEEASRSVSDNIDLIDNQQANEAANERQAGADAVIDARLEGAVTPEEERKIAENAVAEIRNEKKENRFSNLAAKYEQGKRGIKNFFTENESLYDYASSIATGTLNLLRSAERAMIPMTRAILDYDMMDVLSRLGGSTTGRYFTGDNVKAFQDKMLGTLSSLLPRTEIIKLMLGPKAKSNTKNASEVSRRILEFARSGAFKAYRNYLAIKAVNVNATWDSAKVFKIDDKEVSYTEEEAALLYRVSEMFEASFNSAYQIANAEFQAEILADPNENDKTQSLPYSEDAWYNQDNFDWRAVKKNPTKFKAFLKRVLPDDTDVDKIYQDIVHRGDSTFGREFSLVGDTVWTPYSFSSDALLLSQDPEFNEFRSNNLFETMSRMNKEAAKYAASTKYFGHRGRKLDFLFNRMREKAILNNNDGRNSLKLEEIEQAAWYAKAMIDSMHGNFRRIENPKFAALTSYLTSWSMMAGLTLATISSIPETAMVFFKVNDDALFKQAVNRFNEQVASIWDNAAEAEVQATIKSLDRSGFSDLQNAVIDRFATGERDVSFLKAHEVFFRTIGITQFTQFQRRLNAAFAIDYVTSNIKTLALAETKPMIDIDGEVISEELDFSKLTEYELRVFNHLSDLGIDVQGLLNAFKLSDELYRDNLFQLEVAEQDGDTGMSNKTKRQLAMESIINRVESLSEAEKELYKDVYDLQAYIDDQMETAIYNFVNERVQNPNATNRPLFFQDPHYQLLTQFNGFISTFTAQVIPQLYRNQLAKGTMQVKYDTFALIVMLMVLGGASQYIKDKLKFGKPTPYLDGPGYIQRALYSSGILGQYERVVDAVKPLYPDRDDSLARTFLGEAGPSARNIYNLGKGIKQLTEGKTESGLNSILKDVPIVSTINQGRRAVIDTAHGRSPEFEFTNPLDDLIK